MDDPVTEHAMQQRLQARLELHELKMKGVKATLDALINTWKGFFELQGVDGQSCTDLLESLDTVFNEADALYEGVKDDSAQVAMLLRKLDK